MKDRIIYDLCAGTGSWSEFYVKAGYDVRRFDLPRDIRMMRDDGHRAWGILAAPPCTYFCRMRMCRGRPTDEQFKEGLSVVDACLRAVAIHSLRGLQWWVLENPQGYLSNWLGEPQMKFDPWEYGDAWTKRTWLWGRFTPPMSNGSAVPKTRRVGSKRSDPAMVEEFSERARTPAGFAQAFFEANP